MAENVKGVIMIVWNTITKKNYNKKGEKHINLLCFFIYKCWGDGVLSPSLPFNITSCLFFTFSLGQSTDTNTEKENRIAISHPMVAWQEYIDGTV
jgi:hypothetical protein